MVTCCTEQPKTMFSSWPIASLRSDAAVRSLSERNGHVRFGGWLSPVAFDPKLTSPTQFSRLLDD
jgi:hypothetical protein